MFLTNGRIVYTLFFSLFCSLNRSRNHLKSLQQSLLRPAQCSFVWMHHDYSSRPLLLEIFFFSLLLLQIILQRTALNMQHFGFLPVCLQDRFPKVELLGQKACTCNLARHSQIPFYETYHFAFPLEMYERSYFPTALSSKYVVTLKKFFVCLTGDKQ